MSAPADSAAAQLRLCQLHERHLQRQLDSSESTLAQQKETLEMHGQQVEAIEKSGAADMIDQLDQLAVLEESMDSDIWRTQDTIMDLLNNKEGLTTGVSPSSLMFGYRPTSPIDLLMDPDEHEQLLADTQVEGLLQRRDDDRQQHAERRRLLASTPIRSPHLTLRSATPINNNCRVNSKLLLLMCTRTNSSH